MQQHMRNRQPTYKHVSCASSLRISLQAPFSFFSTKPGFEAAARECRHCLPSPASHQGRHGASMSERKQASNSLSLSLSLSVSHGLISTATSPQVFRAACWPKCGVETSPTRNPRTATPNLVQGPLLEQPPQPQPVKTLCEVTLRAGFRVLEI